MSHTAIRDGLIQVLYGLLWYEGAAANDSGAHPQACVMSHAIKRRAALDRRRIQGPQLAGTKDDEHTEHPVLCSLYHNLRDSMI